MVVPACAASFNYVMMHEMLTFSYFQSSKEAKVNNLKKKLTYFTDLNHQKPQNGSKC